MLKILMSKSSGMLQGQVVGRPQPGQSSVEGAAGMSAFVRRPNQSISGLLTTSTCAGALSLFACGSSSVVQPPQASIPELSGDLQSIVSSLEFADKANNAYQPPTSEELAQFQGAFEALLVGEELEALQGLNAINLDLVRFHDVRGMELFIIRERAEDLRGWGFYAVNPYAKRDLILEAPHPVADIDTEQQAASLFFQLEASALLIAGVHRCASSEFSTCSGETSACRNDTQNEPYRISDAAHSEQLYDAAHKALFDSNAAVIAVGIHGFERVDGQPHAFVSDGTAYQAAADSLANRFTANLNAVTQFTLAQSCNDGSPGLKLCGETDLQARYANENFYQACLLNATKASDHFLHIEQSLDLRSENGTISTASLLAALTQTFPLKQ